MQVKKHKVPKLHQRHDYILEAVTQVTTAAYHNDHTHYRFLTAHTYCTETTFPYFTHLLHIDNASLLHTLTAQNQRFLTSHTYCTETTLPYFTHLLHRDNASLLYTLTAQRQRFLTSHTYYLQHRDNVSLLYTLAAQRQRPLTSVTHLQRRD